MIRRTFTAILGCLPALLLASHVEAANAVIHFDASSAPTRFAVAEIEAALRTRGYEVFRHDSRRDEIYAGHPDLLVRFESAAHSAVGKIPDLATEGFALRREGPARQVYVVIESKDAGGAMYGGLELAEQIRVGGVNGVKNLSRNPSMAMRGTKFNIPLDLRSPSYSDMSDSAQENIATVWDFDFWRDYLDALARDRYNYVSLWNLHPFPSMVKVPGFPDVALHDVWRSKIKFDEDYSTRTIGLLTPAMLANKEVVKQLTIDQKIDFWRRVMQYAKDRNIDFYVMTWNVYTYGVDGKYGITDAIDNPKTVDYFRASVREMFRTYPLLRGIGLTAGENMGDASAYYSGGTDSFDAKENWLMATYGQGVLDAARAEPKRQFRLIHRQHESRAQDIAAKFKPLRTLPNVDFVFSFKYAQAHALSSTTQTFHRGYLETLGDLKTLWTIRNDDALMFRWADPDFVREFLKNIPGEKTQGFYVGSDMWVWGREFLDRNPHTPRQLEIDKHWLHTLLWGRLGYDFTLDDQRIGSLVAQRFPGVDGSRLLDAWRKASMVYPLVTGFHWANFDFQWYIEACRSRPEPAKTASGFHSVETFITQPVHPGTTNITIPKYVDAISHGVSPEGTTPVEVARRIDGVTNAALEQLEPLAASSSAKRNAELAATLEDIRAMALLGRYYAAKIRGATSLALYRETRKPEHQAEAVKNLTRAAEVWKDYTARAAARYRNPLWTNRVGIVDWKELDAEVDRDITIARAPIPLKQASP